MLTTETTNHPVWTLYDRFRTARLNVKYYCCRLAYFERISFWFDIAIAVTAPGSAIAGLWFWNTPTGGAIWRGFAVVAGVAAIIKPPLHLTKRIKDYEALVSGYRIIEADYAELVSEVSLKQRFDSRIHTEFRKILHREQSLLGKIPEAREDKTAKSKCQEEVIRELPETSFFIPAAEPNHD